MLRQVLLLVLNEMKRLKIIYLDFCLLNKIENKLIN